MPRARKRFLFETSRNGVWIYIGDRLQFITRSALTQVVKVMNEDPPKILDHNAMPIGLCRDMFIDVHGSIVERDYPLTDREIEGEQKVRS